MRRVPTYDLCPSSKKKYPGSVSSSIRGTARLAGFVQTVLRTIIVKNMNKA